MSLYNNIAAGIRERAAINDGAQSAFESIGSTISGAFGDGVFGQALGAIGANYAENAIASAPNSISPEIAGYIGLGSGAISDILNGDLDSLGVRLLDSGLVNKFIPGIQGIIAQARYWHTPTPLFGGISPYEAKNICRSMQDIDFGKKNLFLVEVSSALYGGISKRFNMFITELDYSPQTITGEKRKVGAATIDSVNSSEPVELRMTTMDDKSGFIKGWFKDHAYMAAANNGTVGVPGKYAIKIKILHGYITRASNHGGYEDIGFFRPGNIDVSLSRRDDAVEEVSMTFLQLDTFIQA